MPKVLGMLQLPRLLFIWITSRKVHVRLTRDNDCCIALDQIDPKLQQAAYAYYPKLRKGSASATRQALVYIVPASSRELIAFQSKGLTNRQNL